MYDNEREPTVLEVTMTIILGCMILTCLLLSCVGCKSSCPQCIPETQVVEVKIPVRYCPQPPEIPTMLLPEWPSPPSEATEDSLKAWYADMAATLEARESILQSRIEFLREIVDSYKGQDLVQP